MPDVLNFNSPDNSFIQFTGIGNPIVTNDCVQPFPTCLPIHAGDDYAFQFYVLGELEEFEEDNLVVRLVSDDDEVESADIPIEWFYDPEQDRTWGIVQTDFVFGAFTSKECLNFIIFRNIYNYGYTGIVQAWGSAMTLTLTVDGVATAFGGGTISTIADIVFLMNTGFTFFSLDAVATQTTATGINIQAPGGNVFGDLVISDPTPETYTPAQTLALSNQLAISNCLVYVENTCFTRVVKYKGHENIFGFNYEISIPYGDFYNQVRLPVFIDNPQPVIDENYFLLSDGSKKVLAARYEKEYDGHTEYFDEADHFRFLAAMKHDVFMMGETVALLEEYTAEGKYDIGWINLPGPRIGNAPASFKCRPTPYAQFNSNCVNA